MTAKYLISGFIVLAGTIGWIGHAVIHKNHTASLIRITRVERLDSGYKMNVAFPANDDFKVTSVDGADVVIERADGREVRVSGTITLDSALDPVFHVVFSPTNCRNALSDGEAFRLRWKLGVHREARLSWLTEHLPRQWRPSGEWFQRHTKENQLVISDWFTFIDTPN